jgi:hyperosmotically inducible periplasmic protein
MHRFRFFGALAIVAAAVAVMPTYVMSQSTTDKMEQKAKVGMQDAKTGITDSWLTAKTKIALFADERVKSGQVGVETVQGVVTLRGKVDSDEAKVAAESVAKAVEHVKGVRNELQVVPPGDRKTTDISDKDITRQIEGRLAADARLKKIDVRTDAAAVILTGAVSSIGVSAHASELARGVPGVRLVKNDLTYNPAKSDRSGVTNTAPRAQVMEIQQALKDKGFDPGPIDGVMGSRTVSALKQYQKSENLTMTGRMDRDTGTKLGVVAVSAEKR